MRAYREKRDRMSAQVWRRSTSASGRGATDDADWEEYDAAVDVFSCWYATVKLSGDVDGRYDSAPMPLAAKKSKIC